MMPDQNKPSFFIPELDDLEIGVVFFEHGPYY